MSSEHAAIPRYRQVAGPALLANGFRPFFLAAGIWATGGLAIWLGILFADFDLPSLFAPLAWHMHEMLFGFVAATIAGFLLTAIPNWTGRMPLQGTPLLMLVMLWLAGRLAMATSLWIGAAAAAIADLAFLAALLAVVLREIIAGRNWRNLPIAAAVSLLLAANALMHGDAADIFANDGIGWRLALGVIVMLISLVGGRIIPSFTRNWLAKRGPCALPHPFGLLDKLALAASGLALVAWSVFPEGPVTSSLLALAAAVQAVRLARWCGYRTGAEPLVWILHLAYAWVPVGLALLAVSAWEGTLPRSMAVHALTTGAIGTITLAVMTRATLGHTGHALRADGPTTAIYAAVTLAAATRLAGALLPTHMQTLLAVSGICWIAAFGGFTFIYGRYLLQRRT
jgi:uncharacterized protein involved in response to NO